MRFLDTAWLSRDQGLEQEQLPVFILQHNLFSLSDIWARQALRSLVGDHTSEEPGTSWIRSKLHGLTKQKSGFHSHRRGWKGYQCRKAAEGQGSSLSVQNVRSLRVINNFSGPMGVQHALFLDAFAKLRKTTNSVFLSDCLSAWNNCAPTGWILMKFGIWIFFLKYS